LEWKSSCGSKDGPEFEVEVEFKVEMEFAVEIEFDIE
jgi:hypothetical protein